MTNDDKALVERLSTEADQWDEPKSHDETDMRGMLYRAADRIEALSAENERLREALDNIVKFTGYPAEAQRPDLFWRYIEHARTALGEQQ